MPYCLLATRKATVCIPAVFGPVQSVQVEIEEFISAWDDPVELADRMSHPANQSQLKSYGYTHWRVQWEANPVPAVESPQFFVENYHTHAA